MAPGRRLNIGEALSEHSPRLDSTTANLGGGCSEGSENKMQEAGGRESSGRRGQMEGLPVIRPDVAGIDLGSERHWVCAPAVERAGREREDFGATTPELIRMGQWLKERRVASVAMESTGVYWIAPHEVLEAEGFEILLVDTRQLARVPGRDKKTDASDCEWIQRLHSCGLLSGSFRPREDVCMLRTLVRDKANLVAESGDWVRRMQKSLDQMNVRVHRAVSDIDGVTGMAILRAIAQGERDPRQLAKLRDPRCRHSEEEIAEQLSGHWREDHLFSLRQFLQMYDAIQQRIADYDPGDSAEARGDATRRIPGTASAHGQESAESQSDQEAGRGADARGPLPDERRGLNQHRRDRGGDGTGPAKRIRAGLEPIPYRETLRLAYHAGTAQTDERGQAGQEETAEHGEHPRCRCAPHGRALLTP